MKKKIYLLIVLLLVFSLLVPGSLSSAADNTIFDGGFEQYPTSNWWYPSEPIGGVFMNSTLNNNNFFDSLVMPAPLCGHGIYNVGKTTYPLDWRNGSVPMYQFTWDGGTLYWQAAMRGPWFQSFFPVTAYSYADIYLLDSQSSRTELLYDYQLAYGDDWTRQYGNLSLAAGTYTLYMGRGASMEKTDANFYKYQLFYDDVYVGATEPAHDVCQESPDQITPTIESTIPVPTVAPTTDGTPTNVVTPTPMQGYHFHTFVDSSVLQKCPDGDDRAGIYLDVNTASYINLESHEPDGFYQYPGLGPAVAAITQRYAFSFVDQGVIDWGTLESFNDMCSTHNICGDQTDGPGGGFIGQDTFNHWGWSGAVLCHGAVYPTATPTLSPTPGPSPTQTTKLSNCGFELGSSGWYFTPPSYVSLAGGPAGPQYAVAVPNDQSLPNIFQNFYWPTSQIIYIQGWAKGQTQVRLWSIYSNFQQALVYAGNDVDWVHWQYTGSLAAGYYRLELNTHLPAGSEGRFDGVTLAAEDYLTDVVCSMYTPTPGPTSFVTPTPGPSLTPSLTMTPRTSITPWGTSTLWPSGTPSLTSTAVNGQTLTAWASITPGGGGATITPGPGEEVPPEQPPGGEGAPCQRPQTWQDSLNIGWWIEYATCDIKRFVSWGPINSATAVAIPTMFANKEPFRTLGDVTGGFRLMQTQVSGKAWNNTGFAGVGQDSETLDPQPDKILKPLGTGADPWAPGATINFSTSVDRSKFSIYCSTNLSTVLAGRLAEGLCFVLNVTKSIGYLGWVQFFTNVLLVFATIRLLLSTIGFYGQFRAATIAPTAETKDG